MNTIAINLRAVPTSPSQPVGFELWLDDQKHIDIEQLTQAQDLSIELSDADGDHCLKFVLKNKTVEHTVINESGEIIQDSLINIENLNFDGLELGYALTEHAVYTHSFNTDQPQIQDKFFGTLGCNGTVALKFSTPIYLWFLENL